jgi:hypothetical protein
MVAALVLSAEDYSLKVYYPLIHLITATGIDFQPGKA